MNLIHSHCRDVFETVIVDEAQKLKFVRTIINRSVEQLKAIWLFLLMITSIINLSLNLLGLFSLLWKPKFAKRKIALNPIIHENYIKFNVKLKKKINVVIINQYFWLLNSETFRQWIISKPYAGFLRSSNVAYFIFFILKLIQLKRTSITQIIDMSNRDDYWIEVEILSMRWFTMKLKMNRYELILYFRIHILYIGCLRAGFDDRINNDIKYITFYRMLCLIIFCSKLDKLSFYKDTSTNIKKIYYVNLNHGVEYFFQRIKSQINLLIYINRAILIYYIYKHSTKLNYIVELVYNICITNDRKIILFCDWSTIF